MSVDALLQKLEAAGIQFWVEGDKLRYRARSGALGPAERAELTSRREEVIARVRERSSAEVTRKSLSWNQRALWFVHQDAPGSAAYNVCFSARVTSTVDVDALRRACQALVDRHAILRTTYEVVDGVPWQRIAGSAAAVFETPDVAGLSDSALRAQVEADYRRPFDLEHGPVFRTCLYTRGPADHVLLLVVHHVSVDGWSMFILLEELRDLYTEFAGGAPASLPRPQAEYADYDPWQREQLASPAGQKLWDQWREVLAAPRATLDLPTDRPRPPRKSYRGGTMALDIGEDLTSAVRALARSEGTTVFVVLLAAFKALLFRYTGVDDLIVGTPTFGRTNASFARVVGDFVNPVPLRTRLDADLSFRDLVARVRDTVLKALAGQDFPLPLMVERLQPARDASRSPLFETMFVLQRFDQFRDYEDLLTGATDRPVVFGSLELRPFLLEQQEGQFDLTMQMAERSDRLTGAIKYSSDLFEEATASQIAAHYREILRAAVAAPATAVGDLPLDAPAPAGASQSFVPDRCLHARFEEQVRRDPEAIAVTCDGEQVSYGALNARANRIAHRLKALGVGPDGLVGLLAGRSIDLVAGVLAILKAGGAYLPIDPAYPQDRAEFMLRDAGATVLLTQAGFLDRFSGYTGTTLLLEDDYSSWPDSDPPPSSGPHNLIYCIYTSGSTGQPKGTLLTHEAVGRLFLATDAWYGFGPTDVWTLFHSIAFDFSVWELWGALAYGGRLVVVPHMVSRSPEDFLRLLRSERVTVLNQTPSAFRALIQADIASGPPQPTALRYVIFGGEALDLRSLRPWVERHGDAAPRLVNMYGITETCVHVTYRPLSRTDVLESDASVIGVPIPDLTLVLLDPRGRPVPVGVPGELYVGGPGLARGYLNRPELTAQRFVPDHARPGRRLYRTGDLARWRRDGDLEYLGRIDHQVKVRGFRIELGEIEALIAEHPAVREQAVIARGRGDDLRLVAYVVADAGTRAGLAEQLRAMMKARLPEYMVPSALVFMDAFPLTGNGKLDRSALPAPEPVSEARGAEAALRTPTEEALAEIWRDLLEREEVWRTDDFFELGGHSLVATRVASRIREVFQLQLPLATIFEASRLEDLARRIDEALRAAQHVPTVPPVTARTPEPDEPLSFSQQRMWIIDALGRSTAYNIPACVWFDGALDTGSLQQAFDDIVLRHEPLRTLYVLEKEPVARAILPAPKIRIEDVPAGDEAALARASELVRELFDLEHGPVMRLTLLRVRPDRHLLVLCVHHVAADNWSLGILFREVAARYGALVRGETLDLPPLPVRYADYARWQRSWLQGDALEQQLSYWRRRLDGLAPLDLPTDRPRPPLQTFTGGMVLEPLRPELADRLEQLSRSEGATLFMTMAAAFAALLHRYSGQDDIAMAVPIANRTNAAIEHLIGTFVNTLVLRVDCGDRATFRTLLSRVRTAALEAFAHQDISFEVLVDQLNVQRDASRPPITGVLFNVLNTPMPPLVFEGLQWDVSLVDRNAAQFDLSIAVENTVVRGIIVEYNSDLFDAASIRRLVDHYQQLLEAVLAAPTIELGRIGLLPEHERQQLARWNGTAAAYPRDTVFSRLFESRLEARPDVVAVAAGPDHLTYGELNARANRLARWLVRHDVGRGDVVGIALPRTPAMLVALLAVQKAGATYLPLDPGFPVERLAYMVADSGAKVLVSERDITEGIEVPSGVKVLDLPTLSKELDVESPGNLDTSASPSDAAYIIYTSGSTGRPKGVAVSHGALVNFLWSMRREPGLAEEDVLAAVTTLSFDIAGLELYLPLLVGARIELVSREEAADGMALAARLDACKATVMQATPATWRMLIEAGWQGTPGFRALCGGEAITRDLAEALVVRVAELWNMYGPTETTIWSTCEQVNPADITIGRPIANTTIHILDRHGQPAPVGIAGEICIGGDGVAIGYHGRPELTAEKFVTDPDGGPGRIYRTGDLGRWRADGRIECLGRLDQQVKVRGYRIEPGEIEALLATHPAIRAATVVAREAAPGDARLVAYVVYHPGEAPTVSELRRFLRKELPEYMIPAVVVPLDALPLTANGKVDRKELPDPYRMAVRRDTPQEPPADGPERDLAEVWQEVLQVAAIGAEDNFFELGGHSLLALRATALFERRTGVRLDPRAFFFQSLRQIVTSLPNQAGTRT